MAEVAAKSSLGAIRPLGAGRARQARPFDPAEIRVVDPLAEPPKAMLVRRLDPAFALSEGLLPWRRLGAAIVVLCTYPDRSSRHLERLQAELGGPVRLARADPGRLAEALGPAFAQPLVRRAETLRPKGASCRSLPGTTIRTWCMVGGLLFLAIALRAPLMLLAILSALGAGLLLLSGALRLAAVRATLHRSIPEPGPDIPPTTLPVITLLVPLYRETEIAGSLLARLDRLDYPRDLLDLCLVVEAEDALTRRTIEQSGLPSWARMIVVPGGTLRTKPRALNYALSFARGSIIGIYDAEDLPAADHLRRVAATFAARDPRTACLQGVLDYFNGERNWLARCFTLEYAAWFRVLLPGLERLGMALPLGGTTVFLRREAIEAVDGWDAHNVTEDADLGIRLTRLGYRTEMIPITTLEEANARLWPWVRQRSRWLKGYAVTWAVHMRDPCALWRDLGPRAFWGFQVMFLGTLLQFALAPILWSFWLVPLGLPHPLAPLLPPVLLVTLSILFLAAQIIDLAFAWVGARRAGKAHVALWAPTLVFYFPLATLALYRALWEAGRQPFRWDKTIHGIDLPEMELSQASHDLPPPPA